MFSARPATCVTHPYVPDRRLWLRHCRIGYWHL